MNDKKRLMDIINLIDYGKNVIDVGTDHGLVPLYLAKNNISKDIIAMEQLDCSMDRKKSKPASSLNH